MYLADTKSWYMERIVRLIAGLLVLLSIGLSLLVSDWFLILAFLVGFNLTVFALTGFCPMTVMLHKLGVREK